MYGALKVSAAKLNTVLPQELVKHGPFDSVEPRNASHVAGLGPHGALLCVTSASLITVTRNDPDVDKLFIPVVVCHNNGGNLQTPFLHCSLARGHRRQWYVGEQCHQMDENKQGAKFLPEKVDFEH